VTRPEDGFEPRTTPLPRPATFGFKIPTHLTVDAKSPVNPEASLILSRLNANQVSFCDDLDLPIPGNTKNLSLAHDKQLLSLFTNLAEGGSSEKALDAVGLAFNKKTLSFFVNIAAKLGLRVLENKVEAKIGQPSDQMKEEEHLHAASPAVLAPVQQPIISEPKVELAGNSKPKGGSNPFAMRKRPAGSENEPTPKAARGL